MTTVTADIAVSLDGYAAGPNQSEDLPFGEGVDGRLHTWMFDHADENRAEIDGIVNAGAYILGRNMFGPGRGDWDLDWKGWWGTRAAISRAGVRAYPPSPGAARDGRRHDVHLRHRRTRVRPCAGRAGRGDGRLAIAGGAATLNQYLSLARSTSFAFTSCRSRLARANASSTASAA